MDNFRIRIGDPCFIITHKGEPYLKCDIIDVKYYKKHVKITAFDGDWDAESGNPWPDRNRKLYYGRRLALFSESMQKEYDAIFMKADILHCLQHWEKMSFIHRTKLGNIAKEVLLDIYGERKSEIPNKNI